MSVVGRGLRASAAHPYAAAAKWPQSGGMFLFFSSKLGWVGSVLVSLIGTVLLLLLLALIV